MKQLIMLLALWASLTAHAEDAALRAEVAKPIKSAEESLKAGKPRDALAKLKDADSVSGRTTLENFFIERVRASAAMAAGDTETAMKSFDAVLATGRLNADEQQKILEAQAGMALRAKDYARAVAYAQRATKDGGGSPGLRRVLVQALYFNGQYSEVVREFNAQFRSGEGRTPGELDLQLLANAQFKLDDRSGYLETLMRLAINFPKKEYWIDALNRLRSKPGFADRWTLDLYRLRDAVGAPSTANDDLEMAQLALQAGIPAEAKKVVDAGFAAPPSRPPQYGRKFDATKLNEFTKPPCCCSITPCSPRVRRRCGSSSRKNRSNGPPARSISRNSSICPRNIFASTPTALFPRSFTMVCRSPTRRSSASTWMKSFQIPGSRPPVLSGVPACALGCAISRRSRLRPSACLPSTSCSHRTCRRSPKPTSTR